MTGTYAQPDAGEAIQMTPWAFGLVFSRFSLLLSLTSLTAVLFALSTVISWSDYGQQGQAA